jgi:hypothetical protein
VEKNNTMNTVYSYDKDIDVLDVYFKKLGKGSVDFTRPALENLDVLLDYSNSVIVCIEFVSITSWASNEIDLMNFGTFEKTLREDGTLQILFMKADFSDIVGKSTLVDGFNLLYLKNKIIGFEVNEPSKVYLM